MIRPYKFESEKTHSFIERKNIIDKTVFFLDDKCSQMQCQIILFL